MTKPLSFYLNMRLVLIYLILSQMHQFYLVKQNYHLELQQESLHIIGNSSKLLKTKYTNLKHCSPSIYADFTVIELVPSHLVCYYCFLNFHHFPCQFFNCFVFCDFYAFLEAAFNDGECVFDGIIV